MAVTADPRDVIGEATLAELEATLRGRTVRPSDPDYDQARAVWNAAHDRHPALIIRCAGTADVVRAVEFARSEGLTVAVRGGAHSVAGFSTSDGGVVVDTSPMKGIRVDPAARRAVAQPGLTWSEFDHETQALGLAVTGGLVSSTGIAGFTLGGGLGWLLRKYGLTCDYLISADVVTADGQLLTASEQEHPDLFWALRGGGGNFGVVTSLEYRLHPVGPLVFAGRCSTTGRRRSRSCGAGATSPPPCPTSSPPWPTSWSHRPCRSCPRRPTARWWSPSWASTPVRPRTAPRPASRCGPWPSRSPT
ncbi:MAG TPA: FAD-binding oxidoreductase [Actinomycetes bacterium]